MTDVRILSLFSLWNESPNHGIMQFFQQSCMFWQQLCMKIKTAKYWIEQLLHELSLVTAQETTKYNEYINIVLQYDCTERLSA